MDSTYVQQAADTTYVAPTAGANSNETFQVEGSGVSKMAIANETVVIDKPAVAPPKRTNPSVSSIMTDDVSDEEPLVVVPPKSRPPLVRSAAKNQKELFK